MSARIAYQGSPERPHRTEKPRVIATRNGRPAYENAPPRLRQSHVSNPIQPMEYEKSFLEKLFGGRS